MSNLPERMTIKLPIECAGGCGKILGQPGDTFYFNDNHEPVCNDCLKDKDCLCPCHKPSRMPVMHIVACCKEPPWNPVHEHEREEQRDARAQMTEMERAHDDTEMR